MKILICGATGFVGRHLTRTLLGAGHQVIRAVRTPREPDDIAVDFRNDSSKETWLPRLEGVDAVINAVGLLRDSRSNPMQKLHTETPLALFAASVEAGVARIVHLSALGVDNGVNVPYFTTRLATERALQALPPEVHWLCMRPSVIYGEDGASAQMFRQLARLPVHVLPMGGTQTLQPVHIDDICAAVVRWLADLAASSRIVEAVGAEATTMRGMLDSYREQLQRRPAWHVAMPASMVRLAARVGDLIPSSPLCTDTYTMLAAGNIAPAAKFAEVLGREPRSYRDFIGGR
ncbi:MAG TPA: NAD-dependent epimerase/dehydratase family protein [Gallionella sp.]|nr:NAD-dependent epimerase/dehydratase family protein [Gallionella sp.]